MAFIIDFLDNLRRGNLDAPYRVIEARPEDYALFEVAAREEGLVMYTLSDPPKCDVVLQQTLSPSHTVSFSLYRTADRIDAQTNFLMLKDNLPLLAQLNPNILNREMLQDITTAMRQHPTWTTAHLAARFGLNDSFKNNSVLSLINAVCSSTMVTPLHVAIKAMHLSTVQLLVSLDARLDLLDSEGNSVFHYVVLHAGAKDFLQALAARSSIPMLNAKNGEGYSPLYLACLLDKPDLVVELLKMGSDPNLATLQSSASDSSFEASTEGPHNERVGKMKEFLEANSKFIYNSDIKNGGTPLHWAKTPQVIEAMVELGCHVNAQNFQGDTALHLMVIRKRLPCLLSLLHNGANVDIPGSDGNTPLHLAIKIGDVSLVQSLVVFGADVNMTNSRGETPRHLAASAGNGNTRNEVLFTIHAVGARRCQRRLESCTKGCALDGDYDGTPPEKYPSTAAPLYDRLLMGSVVTEALEARKPGKNQKKKRCRLLSLDGGGVRGVIIAQMLCIMEKMMGTPIVDCFDWIAGTSTGAMIALALATGKSAAECRCLYFRLKDKVFLANIAGGTELLEKFLQTELGESRFMTDIEKPLLMVTGVLADRHPAELHIFRNYPSPHAMLGLEEDPGCSTFTRPPKPAEQLVWQAARASGAAPTYFKASGPFIDGGLIANNPTLDALTELHHLNVASRVLKREEHKLEIVVSMGTGKIPTIPVTSFDSIFPMSWEAIKGIFSLKTLLIDQATQADGRVVDRANAWCSMIGVPYFRLNPPIFEEVSLNETSNAILVRMLWETTAYMHAKRHELKELASLIS